MFIPRYLTKCNWHFNLQFPLQRPPGPLSCIVAELPQYYHSCHKCINFNNYNSIVRALHDLSLHPEVAPLFSSWKVGLAYSFGLCFFHHGLIHGYIEEAWLMLIYLPVTMLKREVSFILSFNHLSFCLCSSLGADMSPDYCFPAQA